MTRIVLITLLSALLAPAQTLVLNHVRLIDGGGGVPLEDAALVIEKGRIQYAGPADAAKIPDDAETLNLRGKTVVPGIINLHGHVGATKGVVQDVANFTRDNVIANLRTYARYGVTSTTSMGTDLDEMIEYRDERNRDAFQSARVHTALQGFTTIAGYPTTAPGVKGVAQEVAGGAQARARVDQLADKGADLVKMWVDSHHGEFEKLPLSTAEAIIAQARKRGLIAFAHVYELADGLALAKAGIDIIGHSVRDEETTDDFASALIGGDITYVPTLMREVSTYVYSQSPPWLGDAFFLKSIDESTLEALKTTMKRAQSSRAVIDQGKQDLKMAMVNLKRLHDAGVNIGFGTDTGPPGRFAGFFEHLEAELMVEAGLEPMDVIVAWSKNAAHALEIDNDFGVLAKGKVADLVVLNRNPLDNIRNTRSIHAVYLGGKRFR